MKLYVGVTLLALLAVTYAAPRLPSIINAYETEGREQQESSRPIAFDFWPQDEVQDDRDETYDGWYPVNYDSDPLGSQTGTIELNFDAVPDALPVLTDQEVKSIIVEDLKERIMEDFRRTREELVLFKRLFGGNSHSSHRTPWFSPFGWRTWRDDSSESESSDSSDSSEHDWLRHHFNQIIHDDSDNTNSDPIFSGFPLLGIDRPLLPGLPNLPGVGLGDPANLPDNYQNETHEVHNVNGTEVHVNNTIHKTSGDDFNTFFHHQVIEVKPNEEEPEDSENDTTDAPLIETDDSEVEVTDAPAAENTDAPVVDITDASEVEVTDAPVAENTDAPVVDITTQADDESENEIDNEPFVPKPFPDVQPEVSFDSWLVPDETRAEPATGGEDFIRGSRLIDWRHGGRKIAARSLREFNPIVFPNEDPKAAPKSAAYISNSIDTEAAEEFEKETEKTRPPDLSNDTRVNRVHANKQGMVKVNPEAEIFDYGLVLKEAQPREGDM